LRSTRQANHHRVKLADDCAGQPLNRLFEQHKFAAAADAAGLAFPQLRCGRNGADLLLADSRNGFGDPAGRAVIVCFLRDF